MRTEETIRYAERMGDPVLLIRSQMRAGIEFNYEMELGPISILEAKCANANAPFGGACSETLKWSNCSYCVECHSTEPTCDNGVPNDDRYDYDDDDDDQWKPVGVSQFGDIHSISVPPCNLSAFRLCDCGENGCKPTYFFASGRIYKPNR